MYSPCILRYDMKVTLFIKGASTNYFGKSFQPMWIGLTHMDAPQWLEVEGCIKSIDLLKTFHSSFKIFFHYYNNYLMLQLRNQTYYFNNGVAPTYVYSHIVCASKFVMPPTSHSVKGNHPTYELLNETLQLIKKTLEDCWAMDDDA